jgi:hypothetical protein
MRRRERSRRARLFEHQLELLAYAELLQRERDRVRQAMGQPLQFVAVSQYGRGVTPLSLPGNASLESWHDSSLGLQLAAQLIPTGVTPPGVTFDADVDQSLAFRQDTLTTGPRGTATYGLTLDGGLSYFQTGVTAFNVPVPLLGRTLIMNTGTFTAGDTYVAVCKKLVNQTPKVRTMFGAATDSAKPAIVPDSLNGFPALVGKGGTTGGMTDTTSSWALDLCSGATRDFTVFTVAKADSATPSAVRAFWSFGAVAAANPAYLFGVRNGTNLWRANRINDAGTSSTRDAGALDVAAHQWTFQMQSNNVSLWKDGALIINALSLGSGATTLNCAAFFCLFRNSAQANAMQASLYQNLSYSAALTTSQRTSIQQYQKLRYGTP